MNRRAFLKGAAAAAGLAAAGPAAAVAAPETSPDAPKPKQELATLFDLSQCIGCGACVEACREANDHKKPEPQKPFPAMVPKRVKVEDWSERRDVIERLTPYNWLYVQDFEVEHDGETVELHMPRRCMHCVNPPCANLCPWGAAYKEDDGAVRINDEICLGGAKCRSVCPWDIPQRQTGVGLYLDLLPSMAGNGVMYKCDRCLGSADMDDLGKGELPACIEACPMDVQQIGPRDEIIRKAHELAESMNGYIYGETENGGTNTIYVSPVPFETLAASFKPGPGRPGLGPVADSMADENTLATALAVAPLAGLAAGLLTVARGVSRDLKDDEEGK